MALPSPADDGAAESAWRRCCRVLQVVTLPSPAGDDAIEVTLVMVQCRCRGDWAVARYHC
jgi:hypothetical protein